VAITVGVGLTVTSEWRRLDDVIRFPSLLLGIAEILTCLTIASEVLTAGNGTISLITIKKFEDEVGNECNAIFKIGS
jgi:hypothetical protein